MNWEGDIAGSSFWDKRLLDISWCFQWTHWQSQSQTQYNNYNTEDKMRTIQRTCSCQSKSVAPRGINMLSNSGCLEVTISKSNWNFRQFVFQYTSDLIAFSSSLITLGLEISHNAIIIIIHHWCFFFITRVRIWLTTVQPSSRPERHPLWIS